MNEDKKKYENLRKEDFDFMQRDEKIYDKRLETKPIGYFKDAMIRFRKNKTNVVASIILLTLIIFSIFIPIITTKDYESINTQLAHLPPKIPLLENLGIADGTRKYEAQTVDRTTIDPETGLGLPEGFDPELIIMETLENNTVFCTDVSDKCVGGQNVLTLSKATASTQATIANLGGIFLVNAFEPVISIDIEELTGVNAAAQVLVSTDSVNYVPIATITSSGTTEITVYDELEITTDIFTQIKVRLTADTPDGAKLSINSISVENGETTTYTGYELAMWRLEDTNAGTFARSNGEILQATFDYDEYGAAFGLLTRNAFSAEDYYDIIEENSDVCTQMDDPDNPDGWLFTEGCPIVKVNSMSEPTPGPDGKEYFTLSLVLDYQIYSGYDEIPHFFFGTDSGGKDYFALVWLGLRTSLFIGLIVASINISIGIVYGSIEGYYGGKVDLLMERFGEVIGRIPFLVWLALFVIILGPGVLTLIVLLTVTGWLGVASTTRTQFYRYKGREYVLASRTMGAKDSRLIFRHILPNGIGTIITASILMIPGVIFAESTISYLGYGIGRGQSFEIFGLFDLSGVSIGVLLAEGRNQLVNKPYLTFFPALIISILMITFNMFGNALRDAFNPSLRGSE
jgi:ABC-type dipeptide/oligopeptide/nickel transport system permease subunit